MGLGNMGDALRKAGVIDEQRAKQLEKRGKEKGGARQVAALASARPALAEASDEAERAALVATLTAARFPRARGHIRRFHWPEADGTLPFVNVTDEQAQGLESGRVAVVTDGEAFFLVPAEVAREASQKDPGLVRVLRS